MHQLKWRLVVLSIKRKQTTTRLFFGPVPAVPELPWCVFALWIGAAGGALVAAQHTLSWGQVSYPTAEQF